ncbi:DNA binding protein [Gordonia phage ObLaDi]|uniref:DNA binding protein n=1 Tax=Gordonia phage ObLaDi TaxID=2978487 RepID=A0A977KLN4_9CAUD|nr:DNA binding protein [Gordonia phage ObLaDi]
MSASSADVEQRTGSVQEVRKCKHGHEGPWKLYRDKRSPTGYKERCLTCRRRWQKNYQERTESGAPAARLRSYPCETDMLAEEYLTLRRDGFTLTRIATIWRMDPHTLQRALARVGVDAAAYRMSFEEIAMVKHLSGDDS